MKHAKIASGLLQAWVNCESRTIENPLRTILNRGEINFCVLGAPACKACSVFARGQRMATAKQYKKGEGRKNLEKKKRRKKGRKKVNRSVGQCQVSDSFPWCPDPRLHPRLSILFFFAIRV